MNANPLLVSTDAARAPGSYASYSVAPEGGLEALGLVTLKQPALGEARSVDVVLASGELSRVTGFYTPYAEAELGGHLLVPRRDGSPKRITRRLGTSLAGFIEPAKAVQRLR